MENYATNVYSCVIHTTRCNTKQLETSSKRFDVALYGQKGGACVTTACNSLLNRSHLTRTTKRYAKVTAIIIKYNQSYICY